MSKDFLIEIKTRNIGGFEVTGFQYGKSFVTESGARVMVEQADEPNPVFLASLQAFASFHSDPSYKARSVSEILGKESVSSISDIPEAVEVNHGGFLENHGNVGATRSANAPMRRVSNVLAPRHLS